METSTLSAIGSAVVSTIKVAEKIFEICAVDEQAKSVLQTVEQVSGQLDKARKLRRQKSSAFTPFEKDMFDETFRYSENAIKQVATLAERVRADMDVSKGKIRMNSRLLFVLRDSPKVHISLTQLSIANQSLMSTVVLLSSRDGRTSEAPPASTVQRDLKPPPTYEESMFLAEGRARNLKKRASSASIGHPPMTPPEVPLRMNMGELPVEMGDSTAKSLWSDSLDDQGYEDLGRIQYLDAAAPSTQSPLPPPQIQTPPLMNGRARSQRWMENRWW